MKKINALSLALLTSFPLLVSAADSHVTVKAANKLALARASQTIELSAKDLGALAADMGLLHVRDAAGKEVLCQAVDTDFDDYHKPDILIFQADFAPSETKTFTVTAGAKRLYTKDQFKAYGRFVRERFDDFAWENDLIAHRTYGKALETWKGEPLTSSSIDIWSKRVPNMVIDSWYMVDNYHQDAAGEGCDDYSAGKTRGCGGTGFWANDQLVVSKNFVDSRVLANGPIRVMFELVYDAVDVNGMKVSEVKRISLDAGSHLDHYQNTYKIESGNGPLTAAIGLKKTRGAKNDYNAAHGWMSTWEAMEKGMGMQGLAIVIAPEAIEKSGEDSLNYLLVAKNSVSNPLSYWAGFTWDKAGHITTPEAWKEYLEHFSEGLKSPIEVSVGE